MKVRQLLDEWWDVRVTSDTLSWSPHRSRAIAIRNKYRSQGKPAKLVHVTRYQMVDRFSRIFKNGTRVFISSILGKMYVGTIACVRQLKNKTIVYDILWDGDHKPKCGYTAGFFDPYEP